MLREEWDAFGDWVDAREVAKLAVLSREVGRWCEGSVWVLEVNSWVWNSWRVEWRVRREEEGREC